jgi:hypothetical protein
MASEGWPMTLVLKGQLSYQFVLFDAFCAVLCCAEDGKTRETLLR